MIFLRLRRIRMRGLRPVSGNRKRCRLSIVISILILSIIIIVHELGHFLLARKNGITVTEFSVGMGPRIVSTVKGGTRYSLRVLPFGGSCMMLGEDEDNSAEGAFGSKSVWARMAVIFAGPFFNFLLALFLSLIVVAAFGYDAPVIGEVEDGYPAQEAGLSAGDRILSVNGRTVFLFRDVSVYLGFHQDEPVRVVYERDGLKYQAELTPRQDDDGYYRMGIVSSGMTKGSFFQTIQYSFYEVGYWIDLTFQSLGMLVTGQLSIHDMSGPVGIVSYIGTTYRESAAVSIAAVFANMLSIAILLTANLGVINLLPLPALDGGRLIFLIVEAVRGKRVDPEKEGMVHFAGFVLLMILMVVVMYNDIQTLFK